MKKFISVILSIIMVVSMFAVSGSAATLKRLDLAFVVDTTGSMYDDIEKVKNDMENYVDELEATGMDYRVAIIDYRDFPERSGYGDYPYNVSLDFTDDFDTIINGINSLTLGSGGDWEETVCSALIDGVEELSWRSGSGKAVILIGDAPALDPEPYTGYTKEMAVNYLNGKDSALEEWSRSAKASAETLEGFDGTVTVFSIATDSDAEVVSDFEYLAQETGGKAYTAASSSEISDIVEEIIDTIPEVVEEDEQSLWDLIVEFFEMLWYFITFQWDLI